ncbi:hypothetical protein P8C59_007842 [Phyllachora maydis]|uniref:ATP synthase F(0) complex subunit e, mitochondrial n=1 Tax=Phyllachora maydis TaxID=1825666 RepID=A0AAD9IAH8_9PEZI|nr:hypothetical protein P8C59_007842 [Phyllachora maydis]
MSASPGVNVLRYSALGLGLFYGFYHQRSITSRQKIEATKRDYEHKQQLIQQAKEAFAKSKEPSNSLNQDPMDPKFDLEAYFEGLMKEKA